MAKYVAKDILVEVEAATPDTWVAIPQVASIDVPQEDTDEEEVTTLDNADSVKEFLQGFTDGGECTMEIVFDPVMHFTPTDSVVKLKQSGATRGWRVTLPEALDLRLVWAAYVKRCYLLAVTPGKSLRLSVTLRVSGQAATFEAVGAP